MSSCFSFPFFLPTCLLFAFLCLPASFCLSFAFAYVFSSLVGVVPGTTRGGSLCLKSEECRALRAVSVSHKSLSHSHITDNLQRQYPRLTAHYPVQEKRREGGTKFCCRVAICRRHNTLLFSLVFAVSSLQVINMPCKEMAKNQKLRTEK